MMLGSLAILTGCSTPRKSNPILLFDQYGYRMTTAGQVVGDTPTQQDGIWFGKDAVETLQERGYLPGM
jgi:hypothetical protein